MAGSHHQNVICHNVLNKTICPTTQQRYTIEDLQSQNIAVFERPNTIVSLCIDKNKNNFF